MRTTSLSMDEARALHTLLCTFPARALRARFGRGTTNALLYRAACRAELPVGVCENLRRRLRSRAIASLIREAEARPASPTLMSVPAGADEPLGDRLPDWARAHLELLFQRRLWSTFTSYFGHSGGGPYCTKQALLDAAAGKPISHALVVRICQRLRTADSLKQILAEPAPPFDRGETAPAMTVSR
jgi:hypothetical protein